jgi:hypothetical protein
MKLVLRVLQLYLPGVVRNRILDELFRSTAAAFGAPVPQVKGLTPEERLRRYALFTRELAEQALQDGQRASEVRLRLYHNAHELGERVRRELGLGDLAEVMAAGRVLYRALGIEFRGAAQGAVEGEVVIPRCFFSRYYTSDVCRLISVLDEGVVAGLSEGGRLVFRQRLTDGHPCCKARLVAEEGGG